MNDWEQILNWNDTCRFRFVNYKELGLTSNYYILCYAPEMELGTDIFLEAIQKKKYLQAVIASATEACDENEMVAKHIAYSAAQELARTSNDEWGCLCPFNSCVSKPESGSPIVLDDNYLYMKCDCVENSAPSKELIENNTTDCLYPINGSPNFVEGTVAGCSCDGNRKSYLDPITFQWYCICDEENEECKDESTPPTWTLPDYWTHPEIPTILPTSIPTIFPPISIPDGTESCSEFHWVHLVDGKCVCLDSNIQWMGNDGHCYCKVFNIQAHPAWCYTAHVALWTVCGIFFFLLFGKH